MRVPLYGRAIESLVLWSPDPLVGQMGPPQYLCAGVSSAWKGGAQEVVHVKNHVVLGW